MNVFDNLTKQWIQIIDEQNDITIADYSYETGVIEGTTDNHCVKCVAVNQCWFKNEEGKKPEPLILSKIDMLNNIFKGIMPGLYHPHCHCVEKSILPPTPDMIKVLVADGKIDWLYINKPLWVESMGYTKQDREEIANLLYKVSKEAYARGDYKLRELNKHGFKITLSLDFPGKNEKLGKVYKLKAGWTIFPNGTIKCNTLIGGWDE